MYEWLVNFGASIFFFPRFSASNDPSWFVEALVCNAGRGGGGSNYESVLISDFQMLAGMRLEKIYTLLINGVEKSWLTESSTQTPPQSQIIHLFNLHVLVKF